ncbi:24438_t:CDS:1, partial [Cetraspora pellucida]
KIWIIIISGDQLPVTLITISMTTASQIIFIRHFKDNLAYSELKFWDLVGDYVLPHKHTKFKAIFDDRQPNWEDI